MPRRSRQSRSVPAQIQHVFSRASGKRGQDHIFLGEPGDRFIRLLDALLDFYCIPPLAFTLMSNHYHLILAPLTAAERRRLLTKTELSRRWQGWYRHPLAQHLSTPEVRAQGKKRKLRKASDLGSGLAEPDWSDKTICEIWRAKLSSISAFQHDLKFLFAQDFNRRQDSRGAVFADRFGHTLLNGHTALMQCLTYVDANPLQANLTTSIGAYERCDWGRFCKNKVHPRAQNLATLLTPMAPDPDPQNDAKPKRKKAKQPAAQAAQEAPVLRFRRLNHAALNALEQEALDKQLSERRALYTRLENWHRQELAQGRDQAGLPSIFSRAIAIGSREAMQQLLAPFGLDEKRHLHRLPDPAGLGGDLYYLGSRPRQSRPKNTASSAGPPPAAPPG